jgi:hypothetical protein
MLDLLLLFKHDAILTRDPPDQRKNDMTVRAHTPLARAQELDESGVV